MRLFGDERQRLTPVGRLADHRQVGHQRQQRGQPFADEGLIVYDGDADAAHGHTCSSYSFPNFPISQSTNLPFYSGRSG
ncbi:MAG: hypothetical protein ISS49_05515 [Anaerolineae bacterium]|nr:hypothetical protein [Anaerolineae bacterium]